LFRKWSAGLGVFLVLGCVCLQPTREPLRVSLASIGVKDTKSLETEFQAEIRVMNPNETAVEIRAVDCELEINGKPFAAGVAGVQSTIPAYGSKRVPVVLYSSVLDTVNRVIGMIRSVQTTQKLENLDYELKGKLRIGAGDGSASSAFSTKGVLNLEELGTINPRP